MDFGQALDNLQVAKSENSHDEFLSKAKSTIKGSAIGGIVGLMVGWYYHKNLYIYGVVGAITGGAINYFIFGDNK